MKPPAADDGQPTRWGHVLVAVGAGMVTAFHVGKLPPALPFLRDELDLSLIVGGWVVSIFAATGMCLGLVTGSFADRIGHRRVVLAGLVALAIGSFGGSLAVDGPTMLLSRFVEGIGFLTVGVAAPSLIVAAARGKDRGLALGLWSCYMPASMALMLLISPPILQAYDWRVLWQGAAVVSLLWFAVVAVIPMTPRSGGPTTGRTSFSENVRLTLTRPGPWLLALTFPLYTSQWMALMVWLPTFLLEERSAGIGSAARLTALVVAINIVGNLTSGWLMRSDVRHWVLIATAATVMGLSAAGIFSSAVPDGLRFALCLIFSGVGGMLPAAILGGAPVMAPTQAQVGTVNGLIIQGSNLGQFLGPPVAAAAVAASGSWEGAGYVMVGCFVVAVGMALAIRRVETLSSTGH